MVQYIITEMTAGSHEGDKKKNKGGNHIKSGTSLFNMMEKKIEAGDQMMKKIKTLQKTTKIEKVDTFSSQVVTY